MKKLLFSLAMLLTTVGAWAQDSNTEFKVSGAPNGGNWAVGTTWYVISCAQGPTFLSNAAVDGMGQLRLNNTSVKYDDNILWCIVEDASTGYKFYNKAAGPSTPLGFTNKDDTDARAKLTAEGTTGYTFLFDIVESQYGTGNWCIKKKDTDNCYWNRQNSNNQCLMYWNNAEANSSSSGIGSAFKFEEAVEGMDFELTDNAGNVYNGTFTGIPSNANVMPSFSGHNSYTLTGSRIDNNKLTATINFGFPVSKEDGVINWTMISSFANSNFKWYADGELIKTKMGEEILASNIAYHLWAIYPEYDNGFKFTIKNMVTESYIKLTDNANNNHSGDEICLDAVASYFTYVNMRFKDVNSSQCLSTESSNPTSNDGIQFLGTHDNTNHNGSKNVFPDVSYNTNITSAGAATLYTPIAVTIPEGVTAKYVKAADNDAVDGVLVYTRLDDVIPANAAVVLTHESGSDASYTFTKSTEAGETVTDNILFGYSATTTVSGSEHSNAAQNGKVFALANKSNGLGFYPFVGSNYAAGKAYLDISKLPETVQARFFNIFEEDEETAIENIQGAENADAAVYDLAGRRVKGAQKGLYIVNGKVVIK